MATKVADRLRQIEARLDELTDRDREVGREIGAKVAEGKTAPAKLREERREIREELEDLVAAKPHLEREAERERADAEREAANAAAARVVAVEDEAATIGDSIREAFAPIAVELAKVPDLDRRYRAAQREAIGKGNTPASEPMGLSLDFLRTLEDLATEVQR